MLKILGQKPLSQQRFLTNVRWFGQLARPASGVVDLPDNLAAQRVLDEVYPRESLD